MARQWLLGLVAIAMLCAAVGLAACQAAAGALTGAAWTLAAVNGQAPVAEGRIVFATDGTVSFATGCNSGGGIYEVEATRLAFAELVTTKMACDPDRAAQEQAFLDVLSSGPTFVVAGGRLTIGEGNRSLSFMAGGS